MADDKNFEKPIIYFNKFLPRKAILGSLFLITASLVIYFYNPAHYQIYPPCIFHFLTALYCPGCGSLRSIHQLFHGHVEKALSYNILILIYMPVLTVYFLEVCGSESVGKVFQGRIVIIIIGIVLLFFVMRNIPMEPFLFLAP